MVAAGDPVESADITTVEDYTIRKPLVRLIAQSTQTLADNTQTAILFGVGSEDIDTHGFHDTGSNTARITPTVAGYYTARCTLFQSALVNGTTMDVNVRKNGVSNLTPASRLGGAAAHTVTTSGAPSTIGGANAWSISTQCLVSLNGSTDYVEMVARQDSNGSDDTNNSSQFTSAFELIFERPL